MSALQNLQPERKQQRLQQVQPVPKPATGINPNIILGIIGFGVVAIIWLWWHDTPSIHGLGDWLTNAGRITGLGAGYSIVVLLGLMARVPALESGVGADRLARWHSKGGRYTVCLVVAHGLLITWGYSVTDHHNVITETGILWTQYADVLMASVAGLILVGVGVASARAARKRLRYETWLYIHFYTYLATALAFSHQFSTGESFVNNVAARIVWGAMYAGVAALLIWYRLIMPIRQSLQRELRVARVIQETGNVTSVLVTGRNIEKLKASPGQFFRWRFMTRGMWWTANPYSISAVPDRQYLRITAKHLGDHSQALASLKPGTRVLVEGPYGAMTTSRSRQRKVLLIAGGVGITPLRALFETFSMERGSSALLIYRASKEADVVFRDELDRIADMYRSKVIYAVGRRGSVGDIVRPGILQKYVANVSGTDVYLCGPHGITDTAIETLRAAGVKRRHIHLEDFSF